MVLDVDVDKERVSLCIKQLGEDPFAGSTEKLKKGDVVTCTVHQVTDNGIEVQIGDGAIGFIRKSELSRDLSEQQTIRFAVGERVVARIPAIYLKLLKLLLAFTQR